MTAEIKIRNWNTGQVVETVPVPKVLLETEAKPHILSEVVRWQLARARAGTHKTKTKGEVRGGGKKPFSQKGTGNARQGSIRSPLMPGGGKVFGPNPRSYEFQLPKSTRRVALKMALRWCLDNGGLQVFDKIEVDGKTKNLCQSLQKNGVDSAVLVENDPQINLVHRASKNTPHYKALSVEAVNVFDVLKFKQVVLSKESWTSLLQRLGGAS